MIKPRPKLLSIDDHEMLNLMRQKVLAAAGFDCDVAHTAQQGLSLAAENDYDLVLLDYNLPGTTGLQVAAALKAIHPAVPIVVVTGEELCEQNDLVHSYLVKGEGPEALIAHLKKILPSANPRAQSAAS